MNFEQLSPSQLLDELSVWIYQPEFRATRERGIENLPPPLRNVVLFIDFDTEVSMQGMLAFLENSTGKYFAETIDMFREVGAKRTVEILESIREVMDRHGIDHEALRGDFGGHLAYEVTSFAELHGSRAVAMANDLRPLADALYVDRVDGENVYGLLENYVEAKRPELLEALSRIGT